MTTFDSNVWYQLVFGNSVNAPSSEVDDINNSGTGSIFQAVYNASYSTRYHWQLVKLSAADTYVLRSRFLGPTWVMGTFWAPLASLPNQDTRIRSEMYKAPDQAPTSAQWIIQSSGDGGTGLYYLSTVVNGTSWHLESLNGIGYLRDASVASSTGTQKWSFSSVGAINNATWSWTASSTSSSATAISTSSRSTTVPASASASATASGTASQSSQSSGSSTPTGAIVGGVIGGIAVVLLLLGFIFFYRRRRRSSSTVAGSTAYSAAPTHAHHTELDAHQSSFSNQYGTAVKSKPGLYEKPGAQYDAPSAPRRWNEAVELPAQQHGNYR